MTNGAGTCKFSSGSLGDVESFDNLRRREPHDQLARYAVAPAIFIGSVFTHVARSDAGRNCQELSFIFTGRRDALYLYERVGRLLIVDAQHDPWITAQRTAFGGLLRSVENQLIAVDDEPHWCDERSAVCGDIAQLARSSAFGKESDDIISKPIHDCDVTAVVARTAESRSGHLALDRLCNTLLHRTFRHGQSLSGELVAQKRILRKERREWLLELNVVVESDRSQEA
jgi:hypothetical protein